MMFTYINTLKFFKSNKSLSLQKFAAFQYLKGTYKKDGGSLFK